MTIYNKTIQSVIHATNTKYTDFSIEILLSLTIYDFKQKITLNHPTKLNSKDQHLIYSGKLIVDKNILNQVFNKNHQLSTTTSTVNSPTVNNNEFDQENDLLRIFRILIEIFLLCSIICV
ncbi:unnamed protein product [Rotaria sordida]|uniref:Ubiquitin-like domain-containing protein n=2 Tax=Rotaria sordida TaxID=392033 RepID=A0A814H0H7_9BILA|nr:unnamed protein product [Rotaria sordida]